MKAESFEALPSRCTTTVPPERLGLSCNSHPRTGLFVGDTCDYHADDVAEATALVFACK